MISFQNIPNEVIGAFIRDSLFDAEERLRAAKAAANVTLHFPQQDWREIDVTDVIAAVQTGRFEQGAR